MLDFIKGTNKRVGEQAIIKRNKASKLNDSTQIYSHFEHDLTKHGALLSYYLFLLVFSSNFA